MRLWVPEAKQGRYSPALHAKLALLPPEVSFFKSHGQRHPCSLLSTSISPALSSLEKCTLLLEECASKCIIAGGIEEGYRDLMDAYLRMLYAIDAFDDAVCLLVSGFYESKAIAKKGAFKEFELHSKSFRDKLGRTLNAIKHRNCHLRPILMTGYVGREYSVAPGVFVEGVLPDGSLGPDIGVHKDGNSAFSLIRELRYYLVHIYFLCHWADVALSGAGLVKSTAGAREVSSAVGFADSIETTLRTLSNSRLCAFPDEVRRNVPKIHFSRIDGKIGVELSFMAGDDIRWIPRGKIETQFVGDGFSRSFKMPYFGMGRG